MSNNSKTVQDKSFTIADQQSHIWSIERRQFQ